MSNISVLPSARHKPTTLAHRAYVRSCVDPKEILVASIHGDHIRLLRSDGGVECDVSRTLLRICVEREWLIPAHLAENEIHTGTGKVDFQRTGQLSAEFSEPTA